jgi:hypothetical protein
MKLSKGTPALLPSQEQVTSKLELVYEVSREGRAHGPT